MNGHSSDGIVDTAVRAPTGPAPAPQGAPSSPAGTVLGWFIVWQLVFIIASNGLDVFPHRVHQLDEVTSYRELPAGTETPYPLVHALASVTDCWAQLTGQYQMWWLFAPDFPPQATFPIVELRWDDPATGRSPVRIASSLEPANTAAYFHPPGTADRLLHYEANLGLAYVYWSEAAMAREPANWRRLHFDMVQSQWKSLQAYLRWKTTQYLAAHPDLPPPDEVRLIVRLYPSPTGHAFPKEPASRNVCLDQPFVRWRYRDASRGDCLPLEAFDCATGQFVALPHPKHPSPTPRLAYSHE